MKSFILFCLIILALFSRLIPHWPNFTALGAVALFSGAYVRPRFFALTIPLLIILVTDWILGFHSTWAFVYGAWVLIALLASMPFLRFNNWNQRLFSAVSTSLIFFVISNFGVWAVDSLYPKTSQGLMECFLMALPFLKNQVLGDLIFTFALFVIWDRIQSSNLIFQKKKAL